MFRPSLLLLFLAFVFALLATFGVTDSRRCDRQPAAVSQLARRGAGLLLRQPARRRLALMLTIAARVVRALAKAHDAMGQLAALLPWAKTPEEQIELLRLLKLQAAIVIGLVDAVLDA